MKSRDTHPLVALVLVVVLPLLLIGAVRSYFASEPRNEARAATATHSGEPGKPSTAGPNHLSVPGDFTSGGRKAISNDNLTKGQP